MAVVATINWTGIIGTVVVLLIFAAIWRGVSREQDAQRYLAEKYRRGRRRK